MPSNEAASWKPSHSPWLIAVAVMLATFMEVLDTSIANVALPYIAGNLSATPDEATWVLTSYLVSNAIILPASGWLSGYFGRKRLLIVCIAMFTFMSVIAGLSPSLPILIVARALQGLAGGTLQPISQAVLLESFPPEKRGVAMAAFGMGIVVAPAIGPTLGGWFTDNYSWRWIFFINVPVGVAAVFMCCAFLEDPPYIRQSTNARIPVDYAGFGLMAIGLAALQVILDKGQEDDWFGAVWIRWSALICAIGLIGFIIRELTAKHPLVDLKVFCNRNFTIGLALMTVAGAILYSTIALLPLFLQSLLGYNAIQSGYAMTPRGFGAIVAMLIIGRVTQYIDNRWLVGFGFCILASSSLILGNIELEASMRNVVWPNVLNGLGLGFVFVPLTTVTMGTLKNEQLGNATGIFNLMRNLGGSIGISAVTTYVARDQQAHQALMAEHLSSLNPAFQQHVEQLHGFLTTQSGSADALQQTYSLIYKTLIGQSQLWAYVDNFRWIALLAMLCVPVVFLFKQTRTKHAAA